MLKTRVKTGAVLTVIIALVIAFSHIPWVINAAVLCLSLRAAFELYRTAGIENSKWIYFATCVAALIIAIIPILGIYPYIIAALLIAAIFIFSGLMMSVEKTDKIKPATSGIIAVMIIFFFKSASAVRLMKNGLIILMLGILLPVITDIAAYFVGKGIGKHKLAPVVSPKKTVEGCIGGTTISSLILLLVMYVLNKKGVVLVNFVEISFFTVIGSLIGQFGDLAMSAVKRICKVKDYGRLLPGHGGILDRFDSMLFVMPFTYLFFYCFPLN